MSDWIEVKSHRDVPIGNWVVQLERESHGCDIAIMKKMENITLIGDHFAFDHSKVLRYQPLPESIK